MTLTTFFIGVPLILAGLFIRGIAAATIKKNISLTTTGPYQICRHPLYLGSFLLSLGLSVISHNFFVYLFFLFFFPLMYIPTILKEEIFLTERFGDRYINYKKRTPCFIPALKKIDRYESSWKQIKENREYINWLIILLLIAVLLIKSYYPL
ncbi:MAG: hypothetical protein NC832_00650 [Candidatus Omnitrophica bacterium]|nr:hypothetical protein [Candidatus Omnitrophota bacterium]